MAHRKFKAPKQQRAGFVKGPTPSLINYYRFIAQMRFGVTPNSQLRVGSYTFVTDEFSRVTFVHGDVPLKKQGNQLWNRVAADTLTPLIKDKKDHNGHIIADSLWGPSHGANFVGMSPYMNISTFGSLPGKQNTWARAEAWMRDHAKGAPQGASLGLQVKLEYPELKSREFYRPVYLHLKCLLRKGSKVKVHFNPWKVGIKGEDSDPHSPFWNAPWIRRLAKEPGSLFVKKWGNPPCAFCPSQFAYDERNIDEAWQQCTTCRTCYCEFCLVRIDKAPGKCVCGADLEEL